MDEGKTNIYKGICCRAEMIVIIIMMLLPACSIPGKLTIENLAYRYDPDLLTPRPDICLYNPDDSTTRVYLRFAMDDLMYRKSPDSAVSYASFRIAVFLYDNFNDNKPKDTVYFHYSDTLKSPPQDIFENNYILRTAKGKDYIVAVKISDLNRRTSYVQYLTLKRKTPGSRNDFLAFKADSSLLYSPIITDNGWMKLKINDDKHKLVFVKCFHRTFPLPLPPFSSYTSPGFNYSADSVFTLEVMDGETQLFNLHKQGFYHFQTDTTGKAGYTMFRFEDDFPFFTTAESIIPPVRYLTTSGEYEEISNAADKKEAIDNFWLAIGVNPARSKTLIKNYYNRATYANRCFSSYQEGWKTDRGMIYIIFGKPSIVYRSDFYESWMYGTKGSISSTRFEFVKVNNPFTDNDFSLYRLPMYKEVWYMTVENWRR